MFGRRRGILLFLLPLVLIGLAVLVRALVGKDQTAAKRTLEWAGLAVIVPLIAPPGDDGLLAPEIDDGRSRIFSPSRSPGTRSWPASSPLPSSACSCSPLCHVGRGRVLLADAPEFGVGFAVDPLVGGAGTAVFAPAVHDHSPRRGARPRDLLI